MFQTFQKPDVLSIQSMTQIITPTATFLKILHKSEQLRSYLNCTRARDRDRRASAIPRMLFFAPSWVACAVHQSKMPRDTTEIISSIPEPESEGASQLCSKFLWARVRGVIFSHMWMAARLLSSFVRVWSAQEIISVWSGYKYDYFSRKKSQLDHIQCLSLYTKVGNYN